MEPQLDVRVMMSWLRRWLWLIVVGAVLAGGIAYYVADHMAREYQATVTLLVKPANDSPANYYSSLLAGERLALTYSQMIKGQVVIERTINKLHLPMTPDELAGKIDVEPVRDTQLIRLSVTDPNPTRAAQIANTLAELFTAQPHGVDAQPGDAALAKLQADRDALTQQISQAESQIDDLAVQATEVQAKRSQLEAHLATVRNNFQLRTQEYANLVSASALSTEGIRILPPSQTSPALLGPPYTATTILMVEPAGSLVQNSAAELMVGQQALAYAQLAGAPELLKTALGGEQPGPVTGASAAASQTVLGMEPIPNLNAIRIDVTDQSAWRAQMLADRAAILLSEQVKAFVAGPFEQRLTALKAETDDLAGQVDALQTQLIDLDRAAGKIDISGTQANRHLTEFRTQAQALQQESVQLRQTALGATDIVTVTEPAYAPSKPMRSPLTYSLLAAVAGALIAATLVLAAEYMARTGPKSMPGGPAMRNSAPLGPNVTR